MRCVFWLAGLALAATASCAPTPRSRVDFMAAAPALGLDANTYYWGSGFFVDRDGHVLTARHLVTNCGRIEISGESKRQTARLIATSATDDLALLGIDAPFGEPVAFDPTAPESGAMVTILGYAPLMSALHNGAQAQTAVLNSMVLDERASRRIALISDARPGSSGSPVIAGNGLVIGVLESKLVLQGSLAASEQAREIRLAVSGKAAAEFLHAQGIAIRETADNSPARMNSPAALAAAEVKVECHGASQLVELDDEQSALPLLPPVSPP